ncbi:MAG: hypothetical protein PVH96_11560, partial [Gemmatimonadota bacterium]
MRVPSFSAVSPSTTGWAPLVLLFGILPGSVSAQSGTIRQWQYVASSTGRGCELEMVEVGRPEPGPGE